VIPDLIELGRKGVHYGDDASDRGVVDVDVSRGQEPGRGSTDDLLHVVGKSHVKIDVNVRDVQTFKRHQEALTPRAGFNDVRRSKSGPSSFSSFLISFLGRLE
jgi:hypothetical protein